jgi:DNA-binding transcriptional LysR family regulator
MDRLDAMQTFVRVAEAGSFIAVANQLHVARSVVTRQVAALEQHLGTRLITRSTRRLALTTEGAAYLEQCRAILELVDAAETSLSADSAAPRGRIRVGLPLTYGLHALVPLLLDFARENPAVELALDLSDQRSNLIEEGLDLAVRITSALQPDEVVRKLGECRLLTLAAPDYLATHGEPRHPRELADHQCLIYANDVANTHWIYQEARRRVQVAVRGSLVANNGVALMEATARGMGITRQPDFIAAPYLAAGKVKAVLKKFESDPLGIYAVLPGNRYIPRRVSVLIDYLSRLLGPPATSGHRPPSGQRQARRAGNA